MGEKTEKATPKKLQDARKKGQVAKAQDLPSAWTFLASFGATIVLINFLYHQVGDFLKGLFGAINNGNLDVTVASGFLKAIYIIFLASIPIAAFTTFVGVIVTFLITGPVFTFEVFKFDIKKFNPVENLKQKFKLKTLIELLKSLLKIGVATYIVYDIIYQSLPVLITTVKMPISSALLVFNHFLVEAVFKLWFLFIVIAVMDYIYQIQDFQKQMKMEKFEVKQEYKNTEGDPQIKSKRKQIAQEIAYQEGPAGALRKAQAVVTNPTHLAIVLAYDQEIDAAPYILFMGKDKMAEQVIKLAQEYNVPVMRNVGLARDLWERGEIYQYVPEDTYEAIAEVIRWVRSLNDEYANTSSEI